jgi:protein-S-isoprenylcysteine O-methyltransferase Ste14
MAVYLKTLLFTLLVPGSVTILIPWLLLHWGWQPFPMPLGPLRWLGLPLILAGAAGYLRCAWDFARTGRGTPAPLDPPKRFVARGLYRYARNPMYVSVGMVLAGEAIWFEASVLLLMVAAFWLLVHLFVVLYEEPHLARSFGAEYEDYRRRVPRWLPRLTAPGSTARW